MKQKVGEMDEKEGRERGWKYQEKGPGRILEKLAVGVI